MCCGKQTLQMVLNLQGSCTLGAIFLHKQEQLENTRRYANLQAWSEDNSRTRLQRGRKKSSTYEKETNRTLSIDVKKAAPMNKARGQLHEHPRLNASSLSKCHEVTNVVVNKSKLNNSSTKIRQEIQTQ